MYKLIEFDNYYSANKYFKKANSEYNPNNYHVNLFKDHVTNKWTIEIEEYMGSWQIDPCFEQ